MEDQGVVATTIKEQESLNEEQKIAEEFYQKVEEAKQQCIKLNEHFNIEITNKNKKANEQKLEVERSLKALEETLQVSFQTVQTQEEQFLSKHKETVAKIQQQKESSIKELNEVFHQQMESSNELLLENDRQYRERIDELNTKREKQEDENIETRNALRDQLDEELTPLKFSASEEIKKIEQIIQQTRDDSGAYLAALKRKYDNDVRLLYKKNATIHDTFNQDTAATKKNYSDEMEKIEQKEEERRQQLHLQVDALKIQYDDEKSKLLKKSVEAIAQGHKKEAKELKAKAAGYEKFYQNNLQSEQKDAEVDFKAIEEQRKIAAANLEIKLKDIKLKQQIALEENAHALRVLQIRYESEIQKRNLSKEMVENELSERVFKQENANKVLLSSISIKGDIQDRKIVYGLNLYTLDFNKANNENYIDYQCFKINQEFKQTALQLTNDVDLKELNCGAKKEMLTAVKEKDLETIRFQSARKILDIDSYLNRFKEDLKKKQIILETSKEIKQKIYELKRNRIQVTSQPYLERLDKDFTRLKARYQDLMDAENVEYVTISSRIDESHNEEVQELTTAIETVSNYRIASAPEMKTQLENLLQLAKSRYKMMKEEMLKNHNKMIKGYESKIQEAAGKLEENKKQVLENQLQPLVTEVGNYSNQLFESECNSAISGYASFVETMRLKADFDKNEVQRNAQNAMNNIVSEYNKAVEALQLELKNFKYQNDIRLKEEETIRQNRLNEIEKNRQSALNDYQIAKLNSQKQYEIDLANYESKLSLLEQEIERSNSQKAQSVMKANSEIIKQITVVENLCEKQITASKAVLEKNLKSIR